MKVYKEKPIIEICLRKYEKPYQTGDDLLRKFCISIGLLQPGDSRDTVVDVMKILLNNRKEKILMDSNEISSLVKQNRDIADSFRVSHAVSLAHRRIPWVSDKGKSSISARNRCEPSSPILRVFVAALVSWAATK